MRAQAALWGWLGSRGCLGNTGGDGAPPLRDGTGYVDEGAGNGARAGAEAGPYAWGRWLLIKCVYKKWAVCVGAALCGRPRGAHKLRFGDGWAAVGVRGVRARSMKVLVLGTRAGTEPRPYEMVRGMLMKVRDMGARAGTEAGPYEMVRSMGNGPARRPAPTHGGGGY